jgi:hypothetical protein
MGYQLRLSPVERVELGLLVGPAPKLDVKIQALRTRYVDLSFDPWIEAAMAFNHDYIGFAVTMGTALPVLVDVRITERVALTGYGGAIARFGSDPIATPMNTFAPLGGGALSVRITEYFSMQAAGGFSWFDADQQYYGELANNPPLEPIRERLTLWSAGLAFSFGAQPDRSK